MSSTDDIKNQDKLVVIDGNSLLNRAFYALPLLQTKQGIFTNAIYGFVSMLLKLIEEEYPDDLAVVFDTKAKTFRHHRFPEYKGHRDKAPEEMHPQIPMLKQLLDAMNVKYFEKDGFEADDLIGAFSNLACKYDKQALIVTGDKDLLQLLDDNTSVMLTKKGITQMEYYDEDKVKSELGVNVEQLIDLKALTGDKSDNVPGVPGVGEKTALKLLKDHTTLDDLYENIEQITGKMKDKLTENQDQAYLSRELVTIYRDESILEGLNWEELSQFQLDTHIARELLREWEMNSILERLPSESIDETASYDKSDNSLPGYLSSDFYYISNREDSSITKLKEELTDCLKVKQTIDLVIYRQKLAIDQSKNQKLFADNDDGLIISLSDLTFYISQNAVTEVITDFVFPKIFDAPKQFGLVTYNIKSLWHYIYQLTGTDFYRLVFKLQYCYDVELMAYIADPTGTPHEITDIKTQYAPELKVKIEDNASSWQDLCKKGRMLLDLATPLEKLLQDRDQWSLYNEIEFPLAFILARMEYRGITVQASVLDAMEQNIDTRIADISTKIFEISGEEFNLNSPKQLGYILFEKLHLPVIKKTKTGYSTDAKTLETLAQDHEICKLLLDYRQLHKLKTTYLSGLKDLIFESNGKIHTTFNQTITATGRLSSTEPNLQNIPIKLEEGRKIRRAFVVGKPEQLFLAADYSQIELRILAHVSGDDTLIKAFQNQEDIHTQTAAQVFHKEPEDVSKELRSHAKAVNFGIVYGISDYGLATQLGIPRKQAQEYIDAYFDKFSGVKKYMDDMVTQAKYNGYVTTLYHRSRDLPDINHSNFNIRTAAERTAINTPIQGTAADIIKDAMVKVEHELEHEGLLEKARLLLQVHDELILEVSEDVLPKVAKKINDIMENIINLQVPLTVDLKTGANWYDLQPYQSGE